MRNMRLKIVLPVAQVTIGAILTLWADRVALILIGELRPAPSHLIAILDVCVVLARSIFRGINAPALPFRGLILLLPQNVQNRSILGLMTGDLFFLTGVAIVWYAIGRMLDRRRSQATSTGLHETTGEMLFNTLLAAWGGFLFVGGLWSIRESIPPVGFRFGLRTIGLQQTLALGSLVIVWSLILLIFAGLKLARGVRSKLTSNKTSS